MSAHLDTNPDTEALARRLRDRVYGVSISDISWACVARNWTRPDSMTWLAEHARWPYDDLATGKGKP